VTRPVGFRRGRRVRPLDGRPSGPEPTRLAVLLVQVWLEVRAGRRPLEQLAPLVAPAARHRLVAQLPARPDASTPVGRARPGRSYRPAEDACETSVLVDLHGRTTAYAVRLERHRGCWRVVELTSPETGLSALPTASLDVDVPLRDAFDEAAEEAGELAD
jgi:hypothetical protein